MTIEQRAKICKRMLWIIPGMILAIIGDYCMGIEPKESTAVSFLISTGWIVMFLGGIQAIKNDGMEAYR